MSAPPRCELCGRDAEPKRKGRHPYHRHCCYSCFDSAGQRHDSRCTGRMDADKNWRQNICDRGQGLAELSVRKRCRLETGFSMSNRTEYNQSLLDEDVEFSLLQNLVLNRFGGNGKLQERWKDLFREYNRMYAHGNKLQTLQSLYILPQQDWDEIADFLPDLHRVDATSIDCRSIRKTYGGDAIFRKGGKSVLLQEWIMSQECTVRLMHELLLELQRVDHAVIVFICEHARHRSISFSRLFKQFFVPHADLFCPEDMDLKCLRDMLSASYLEHVSAVYARKIDWSQTPSVVRQFTCSM